MTFIHIYDESNPPLTSSRISLNMKAVHIQCLDKTQQPIKGAYASGFLVQEGEELFLYTCWHVVTGFNMHDVKLGYTLPNRKFLEVSLQFCDKRQLDMEVIGKNQTIILPLYNNQGMPLWTQNKQDVPHYDLNNINIKVPFWHDTVKLLLPNNIKISDIQLIKENEIWKNQPMVGDKVYIAGYPYGYSTLGLEQPTAIVLTRFIAAGQIKDRQTEKLLDGPGAPGMSGGPVFIEQNNNIYLSGIYSGLIYPDHQIERNEKSTALGTMCDLSIWWVIQNLDE